MIKTESHNFFVIASVFGFTILAIALYLSIVRATMVRLRDHHTGIWNKLGRPEFPKNNICGMMKFIKFSLSLQFLKLEDPTLITLFIGLLSSFLISALFMALLAILFHSGYLIVHGSSQ